MKSNKKKIDLIFLSYVSKKARKNVDIWGDLQDTRVQTNKMWLSLKRVTIFLPGGLDLTKSATAE